MKEAETRKIALCGASMGGKTTLATELKKIIGPGFSLVNYSRPTAAALKMGFKSAAKIPSDDQTQWDFQVAALCEQIRAQERAGPSYVIDRSVFDFAAYLGYRMPWLKNSAQYDLYMKMAMEFNNYDYLFFVPNPNEVPVDNGMRWTSDPRPVEEELLNILNSNNIDYYHIKSTTIGTRLAEILDILGV